MLLLLLVIVLLMLLLILLSLHEIFVSRLIVTIATGGCRTRVLLLGAFLRLGEGESNIRVRFDGGDK